MQLLHTADWHLGRSLHGAALLEDQAHLLEQFVDLVRDERPDVVLMAGDVYDRAVPPAAAVELLDDVLSRIVLGLGVPVIAIAGNHDSPERLSFGSRLLREAGLHLRGDLLGALEPVVLHDVHGPIGFHPVPFLEPAVVRHRLGDPDLAGIEAATAAVLDAARASRAAGARSVVVAHGFVSGMAESESERPLSLGGSACVDAEVFRGFDYVALGHLHRPQAVAPGIRYAGSLMRYSFSEADHDKEILAVELGPDGACTVRSIVLSPRHQVRCLEGTLAEVLAGAEADGARDDYLSVTLTDREPVFDAMGKLRQVYPNVLHIERPALQAGAGAPGARIDHRKIGVPELFSSFFQEVTGRPLDEEQHAGLAGVLEGLDPDAMEAAP
ncbi:MAG TPA: exonuclease SbcCD subunit D [Phycisphaerae bacterium]|nr:exonuclease SbcCD subunit D [Phycisphaerae bacterium]